MMTTATTQLPPTNSIPPFKEFDSIPRLFRDIIVTEKIDGTNASIHIFEDGTVIAGSRTRYITPLADNYGFAKWVEDHVVELFKGLGPGTHYGEWWGSGVNRGYGFVGGVKFFSLFNVSRWLDANNAKFFTPEELEKQKRPPSCCSVVPIIGTASVFDTELVKQMGVALLQQGSQAAPGFMKPEGLVVYHVKARQLFKYTFEKNDGHKGGK